MQTNCRACERFGLSLSHAARVSVDAFAHMHCWCEVLTWSRTAGPWIVGSVSRIACSLWINTPRWRGGLLRRHTWCPSSPSSRHGWAELQWCSPTYAHPEINLASLVKLVSYPGKVISYHFWPKGNRCQVAKRFCRCYSSAVVAPGFQSTCVFPF